MGLDIGFIEVAEVLKEWQKAILVRIHPTETVILDILGDDELCVPKSQIHEDSEVWHLNDSGNLVIKGWFADKLGIR